MPKVNQFRFPTFWSYIHFRFKLGTHIEKITPKACKKLDLLKRHRHLANSETRLYAYNTLLHSSLEYAQIIWYHHKRCLTNLLIPNRTRPHASFCRRTQYTRVYLRWRTNLISPLSPNAGSFQDELLFPPCTIIQHHSFANSFFRYPICPYAPTTLTQLARVSPEQTNIRTHP